MHSALPGTVSVVTADSRYDILIQAGLLQSPDAWANLPRAAQAVIVSNPHVASLYESALRHALAPHYRRIHSIFKRHRTRTPPWPNA